MREKWTKNLGMKILSLVFAVILWIVIVNIADPVKTTTFYDVPVEKRNESAIFSLDQVYEVVSGNEVNVTVKGKKSIIDSIQKSDIKAVADLSELSRTLAVNIDVYLVKSVGGPVELSLGKVRTLKLNLEDKSSKSFKVTVLPKGAVEDGYMIGKATAKPNMITVSGGKSQIEKIAQIGVEADVSNASSDIKTEGVPKAYDKDGNLMDSNKFQFSLETVDVSIKLLKTKQVALNITTSGEPYYGYQYINMEYEPKKITIAGEADVISSIYTIPITIDIANAMDTKEEEIDIMEELPDNVFLNDENSTVTVRVIIEKLQVKEIAIPLNLIEEKDLAENLDLEYSETEEPIIKIMGLEDNVKSITAKDLKPYLDLAGKKAGTHTIPISFAMDNQDFTIINSASLKVVLTKKTTLPEEGEEPNNNEDNGNSNNENNTEENPTTENPNENNPNESRPNENNSEDPDESEGVGDIDNSEEEDPDLTTDEPDEEQ